MCGITGVFDLYEKKPVDIDLLVRANNLIHHRGPDDKGILADIGVGLAMRRLSKISLTDISRYRMKTRMYPSYSTGRFMIITIFGSSLKRRAIRLPHIPIPRLLCMDMKNGESRVSFPGSGACSPLHYGTKNMIHFFLAGTAWESNLCIFRIIGTAFIFRARCEGYCSSRGWNIGWTRLAVEAFLTVGFVPCPYTIWSGINKLPAAHYLIARNGGFNIKKYWELSYSPAGLADEREITEEFFSILDESIRMHLLSEVPLGVLLSGGIDSATIAALAQRHSKQPLTTISIGFESDHLDEAAAAKETAKALGTNHVSVLFQGESMDDYPKALYFLEEPLAEPVFVTEFKMHKACRENGLKDEDGRRIFQSC